MTALPTKAEWIAAVRAASTPVMPRAYDECVGVLQHLAIYGRTEELAGPALDRVLTHMGLVREAIGAVEFPEDLEATGWALALS